MLILFIKNINNSINVVVKCDENTTTINQLKKQIANKINTSHVYFNLIFSNTILEPDELVSNYNIPNESTLHLVGLLSGSRDKAVCEEIKRVNSHCNKIQSQYDGIGQCFEFVNNKLEKIFLHQTKISSLIPEIGNLSNLTYIFIRCGNLESLPKEIGKLKQLEYLRVNNNEQLTEIPQEISQLENLRRIDFCGCSIKNVQPIFKNNKFKKLIGIDFGGNKDISVIPPEIGNIITLIRINFNGTNVSSLPSELGNLVNLRRLKLLSTNVTRDTIPKELDKLTLEDGYYSTKEFCTCYQIGIRILSEREKRRIAYRKDGIRGLRKYINKL